MGDGTQRLRGGSAPKGLRIEAKGCRVTNGNGAAPEISRHNSPANPDGVVSCPRSPSPDVVTPLTSGATGTSLDWPPTKQALREYFHEPPLIVFGTGPSCAVDRRFGMGTLAEHLRSTVPSQLASDDQRAEWGTVDAQLGSKTDLETALTRELSPETVAVITAETAAFVGALDREYAAKLAEGSAVWSLTTMLRKLVGTFPNTPALHAVTPNYDLLMEYACDADGIEYTTGFVGGVSRRLDWARASCAMSERQGRLTGKRVKRGCVQLPHVRLHKVHGSLNLFVRNGDVVENNAWLRDPPSNVERVMITPGRSKYERVLTWREGLLKATDAAIAKAAWFLFVGYGMNDNHLETKIRQRLTGGSVRGIVVTLASNDRIEALVREAANLWLVCGDRKDADEGTRIANGVGGELFLPGQKLWDISQFTSEVLGA